MLPRDRGVGWGALAASSLVIGALLGLARPWPPRPLGLVLAFGAGALISAVSFDLAEEGARVGDPGFLGLGLAVGALTYFALNRVLGRRSRSADDGGAARTPAPRSRSARSSTASPSSPCSGSASPRARASASACSSRSSSPTSRRRSARPPRCAPPARRPAAIRRLWLLVALICTAATVVGYAVADSVSGNLNAVVDGFAAGALLVMLIDSMIPEAVRKGGDVSGLVTVLGFAVAAALSGSPDPARPVRSCRAAPARRSRSGDPCAGDHVVVLVVVEDPYAVVIREGREDQIRRRQSMVARAGELPLSVDGT